MWKKKKGRKMSVCAFLWRENNVLRYKERSKENNNNNRTMQPCGSEMGKGVTNVSIKKTKENMWAWEEIREDHLKNEGKRKGNEEENENQKGKKRERI